MVASKFVTLLCLVGSVAAESASNANVAPGGYATYYAEPQSSPPSSSSSGGYAYHPPSSYGAPAMPSPPQAQYGVETLDNTHFANQGYSLNEETPFVQQRLFNTAVALTVPLFSFQLPQRSVPSGGVDLANQAIFGVFALFIVALVFAVPILFTKPPDALGRSSRDGILNHLMNNKNVINFMGADLTNKVGLDTTKCLQKSICEAHRTPKKYGLLATPFTMFFPPPSNETTSVTTSSIFQLAAKDGKYTKTSCGKKYNCFFDTLDLAGYLVDWWKHAGDPNYVIEM